MYFHSFFFIPIIDFYFLESGIREVCGGSRHAIQRMLDFGRELYNYSQQLFHENGSHEQNKKMLQVFT